MTKRMLVDAIHPEETRVAVVDAEQLVDFDFESSTKTQLKGNVYLAKVTRVEPSLQAAFVEYGGNRHGFLAFSEIHPDYYQIPQADRELLEKLEREAIEESRAIENAVDLSEAEQPDIDLAASEESVDGAAESVDTDNSDQAGDPDPSDPAGSEDADVDSANAGDDDLGESPPAPTSINDNSEADADEVLGEQVRRRERLLRNYKIQEVIKRRQILLVQVVKEERGNKGAALTTYLSLAGRYCVLMPNTPRGGGISRKITNANDRRRLKTIIQDMDVPHGMGLIVRTAGQQRNKSEIRRDYDFLLRQWSEIRETTLESVAPALIYQEGNLIKRAMRDLYSRDIEEVLIEGEGGYKAAKKLMTMMMPSHARRVKLYKEDLPLFYRHHIEDQLDQMHSPVVELPSGGSIVIHTTEALTAIDVNSGRSTRERHIDETAVKTNLEAADEVARQLRLRDVAGLVVIDFIDMGEHRHQRQVERRLREALKLDRARLQVGRISMFGLLELSRQRLRASLLELSSKSCPTCLGLGVVRSTESCALHALRCVQEEGIRNEAKVLQLWVPPEVALYLLNQKREALLRLEARYKLKVLVTIDNDLLPSELRLEIVEQRERDDAEPDAEEDVQPARRQSGKRDRGQRRRRDHREESSEEREPQRQNQPQGQGDDEGEEEGGRKRRRRRRRRRRDEDETQPARANETPAEGSDNEDNQEGDTDEADRGDAPQADNKDNSGDEGRRRRRRRRRARSDRNDQGEDAPPAVEEAPTETAKAEDLLAKLQKFVAIEPKLIGQQALEPSAEQPAPTVESDPPAAIEAAFETDSDTADAAGVADDAEPTIVFEPEVAASAGELAAADIESQELPAPVEQAQVEAEPEPQPVQPEPQLVEPEPVAAFEETAAVSEDVPSQPEEPANLVGADAEAADSEPPRRGWWNRFVR